MKVMDTISSISAWTLVLSQLFSFVFCLGYFFYMKTSRLIKWGALASAVAIVLGFINSPSMYLRQMPYHLADLACMMVFLWMYILRGTKPIRITAIVLALSKCLEFLLLFNLIHILRVFSIEWFLCSISLAVLSIPFYWALMIHQEKEKHLADAEHAAKYFMGE
jgi:hypothetical protein